METIQISEIQIIPIKPREGLVAFASCIINNFLYIGSIGIYTSPSKPGSFRLVYPSKTLPNGKAVSCVHPINKKSGEFISIEIIEKYKEIMSKAKSI